MSDADDVMQHARALLARVIAAAPAEQARLIAELRPAPEDYALAFVDEVIPSLRAAYEAIWRNPPSWRLRPDQTVVRVAVASVEELRAGEGPARAFPGGYREAAASMRPGVLWVAWDVRAPGASAGMAFDGLIRADASGDGRWAWLPKPWRALRSRPRTLSHWSE